MKSNCNKRLWTSSSFSAIFLTWMLCRQNSFVPGLTTMWSASPSQPCPSCPTYRVWTSATTSSWVSPLEVFLAPVNSLICKSPPHHTLGESLPVSLTLTHFQLKQDILLTSNYSFYSSMSWHHCFKCIQKITKNLLFFFPFFKKRLSENYSRIDRIEWIHCLELCTLCFLMI